MRIKNIIFYVICIWFANQTVSQTNNLSSSPYSSYGLGVTNSLNTGKINTLGYTGIAMTSNSFINNLNPAAYGSILPNSFFYDIGLKAETIILSESGNSESRINGNFSNLAFAFPLSKNSGAGITLLPYTNVGYNILGVETYIEGSNESFLSNINGTGGLSDLTLNYGYAIKNNFRIGVFGSYLFGSIEEEEIDIIGGIEIYTKEDNYYKGFRFGIGLQYELSDKISFGAITKFPTQLDGKQTQIVSIQKTEPIVNDEFDLDAFKLPLELGFGLHVKLNKTLFINIDYNRNFWNETGQNDYIGDYVDQDILGIGAEFTPNRNGFKYWKRIQYRTGFNIDNGYLSVNDTRINNYTFTFGVGLPMSRYNNSILNFGYSYGKKGLISNGLIQENYHLLNLNVSLEGHWFVKRKLN